MNNQPR